MEQSSIPIDAEEMKTMRMENPTHTGFGSEEDTLANCLSLTPKPPRKDLVKIMTNTDKVLRFEARMDNKLPEDKARRFILGCFLTDDSIAVWETRARNSGHTEGKFAERSRKRNPSSGNWYTPADFFIGGTVVINSVPFFIYQADEYTLKFMEGYADVFPQADMVCIAEKIQDLKDVDEFTSRSTVTPDELRD